MSIEENIKKQADELIDDLRKIMESKGEELTKDVEYYIRVGMSYGIRICSKILAITSVDCTLGENK